MTPLSPIIKKQNIQLVKDKLVEQLSELQEFPFYYVVVQFGFYDNSGIKLPQTEVRKFYDKEQVSKTCKLIRNKIREALNPLQQYFFLERHTPLIDEYGDTIQEGRFHINLIVSPITDDAVLEPNRKCRRLLSQPDYDKFGIPIENQTYQDIEEYKVALLNACIRTCGWVNKYQYSVKTQLVETPEDLEEVSNYCLKTYKDGGKDFMDIVEFSSSDFYSKH
jgi:hypothetical protein